ncbi:unnamed protein product [Mytilus coruscus]|uniref:Integrase catalytic domain-containing protein n=1 Tax=Mytilus coruscus TaxID=42192 RepID=A0A6J8BCI5_MYTCO|nr:unnamed protein product [Mytilus coruscus]
MNTTVNDILSKYIKKHQKDWDEHLDYIVMAYNATPHESTGIIPHRMIYDREMSFPLNLMTETVSDDNEEENFISEFDQSSITSETTCGKPKKNVPGIKLKIARHWTGPWSPLGTGASGDNTLEPDDVYNSDSDTCTTTSGPDEIGDSHIDSVEIVNLSLITIRSSRDGVSSVRREHNFATSTHYDPRSFDWRGFIRHMEEELCEHAEALR